MNQSDRIFVAGHKGLVGSAIMRALDRQGFEQVFGVPRGQLDLEDQPAVFDFFEQRRPEHVFMAAAKVGGIRANSMYPADFIRSNLVIQVNLLEAAYRSGVKKVMFFGSSCIYPRLASQPISESALLSGPLEPTNQPYAIAKIAGIEMCQAYNRQYGTNYISVMPTNLYGPGDNFDLETAHVLPALLHRFHLAKVQALPAVTVWGTGKPRREFLHVDDLAEACLFLMQNYDSGEIINIGFGEDHSIAEMAELVKAVVGFPGELRFDASQPDGTPRKLLDSSKLRRLGWEPRISLQDGLRDTYAWFQHNLKADPR